MHILKYMMILWKIEKNDYIDKIKFEYNPEAFPPDYVIVI